MRLFVTCSNGGLCLGALPSELLGLLGGLAETPEALRELVRLTTTVDDTYPALS